jgi:dienelactone hydrolase
VRRNYLLSSSRSILLVIFFAINPMAMVYASGSVKEYREHFVSGEKKINVEIFSPAIDGTHPAVLVLHGAGGLLLDEPAMRRFARALADNGFEAFLVHYFDRTGTIFARGRAIHAGFESWRSTVDDAVDYVAGRSDLKPRKIGCFGYSLGAYLSLAQAARDSRILAVVELAGAIDREHAGLVKRLPPTLILHGSEDARVPVQNAYNLEKLAARLGVTHEIKIYQGEGHVLRSASQADAAARAVCFFQKHLAK